MKECVIDRKSKQNSEKTDGSRHSGRRDQRNAKLKKPAFRSEGDAALAAKLNQKLTAGSYIVFDIESTGGNPDRNGITEICALKMEGDHVVDRFYSLVNPRVPIPGIVRRMTGITNQMVKHAPLIEDVMPKFVAFCADSILVSHNTVGDMKFLRHFSQKTTGVPMANFFQCTHLLAEKLLKESKDKSLLGLSKFLGFDLGKDAHRADVDAELTLQLYRVLRQRLIERGIESIDQAIRFQGDFESAMRLGWGIEPERLNHLPQKPGIIRIIDQELKTSFLTSAQNLQRDIRRLQRFQFLPRPLLKAVLAAKDIEFEETSNLFAASLKEAELLAGSPALVDPAIWHNKALQFIYVTVNGGKAHIKQGPLAAGAVSVVGPVRGGKEIKPFLSDLKEALTAKSSQRGLEVDVADLDLLKAIFNRDGITIEMPWSLKLFGWLPSKRPVVSQIKLRQQKLGGLAVPPELIPLKKLSGLFGVAGTKHMEWYLVLGGLPQKLENTDLDANTNPNNAEFEMPEAIRSKALTLLKGAHPSEEEMPLSLEQAHLINRLAWWVSLGDRYFPVRFWTQENLQNPESTTANP